MLKFQTDRRINKSILLQKWPRIISDIKDDAYETPVFVYSRWLDVLISASSITRSDVEEKNFPPCPKDAMSDLEEEMMNLEETTLVVTPQFATSSNELNEPPMAPNLAQYV